MMKRPLVHEPAFGHDHGVLGIAAARPITSVACVPAVSAATPGLNVGAGVDLGLGVDAGWVVGVGGVAAR